MTPFSRYHWSTTSAALLILALLGFIVALQFFDTVTRLRILREGSYVELSSAILWLACGVAYTCLARQGLRMEWHRMSLLLLAGFRELDFHVRFTGESIFNGGTYSHAHISTGYRVYSVIAVMLIAATLVRTATCDGRCFLTSILRGERVARLLACALVLLAVAKTIDGLRGRAEDLDFALPWAVFELAETAEEVLELGGPAIVAIAITVAWQQRRTV